MNVSIKEFNVEMSIKNRGIELDVCNPQGKHVGDLIVTKTELIWCAGRTSRDQGVHVPWDEFIEWMQS